MALGTWGEIRVHVSHVNVRGRPDRFRAVAGYRDFDGKTRQVERYDRTKAGAVNRLRIALKERSTLGRRGELTAAHRFGDAAAMWLAKIEAMAAEDRRSPGTVETYRWVFERHVKPALEELRLAEVLTPVVPNGSRACRRRSHGPSPRRSAWRGSSGSPATRTRCGRTFRTSMLRVQMPHCDHAPHPGGPGTVPAPAQRRPGASARSSTGSSRST
jgi:hypothetical protein